MNKSSPTNGFEPRTSGVGTLPTVYILSFYILFVFNLSQYPFCLYLNSLSLFSTFSHFLSQLFHFALNLSFFYHPILNLTDSLSLSLSLSLKVYDCFSLLLISQLHLSGTDVINKFRVV